MPPGRPDALAKAVTEVLRHRDNYGAAGRERARRFGADGYARRVRELL